MGPPLHEDPRGTGAPCPFMLASINPSEQPVLPWKPLYINSPKESNGWLQGHHILPVFLRVVECGRVPQSPFTAVGQAPCGKCH